MIKVFTKNKNGKIELTEEELTGLLDEAFKEGMDEDSHRFVYRSPLTAWPSWYPVYYTAASNTIDTDKVTISASTICKE